jgi:hypothetical protein
MLVIGMFFLTESPRWIARFKGREPALKALSKLRNLPEEHPYLQEEIYRVLDQIEQERQHTAGKGMMAELKEMVVPGNRKRITIGVLIFIFMQFAGSNAINYYSPRIFASIGLTGTNTRRLRPCSIRRCYRCHVLGCRYVRANEITDGWQRCCCFCDVLLGRVRQD